MAKTKTPFFGLGSQGSVGESITTQKRGRDTLVRTSPVPTDPYTLPQAYQRWLYRDYAHLWTQQSTATRQEYATAGSRFHRTGFQQWMSVMLSTLPDIAGYWKLDINTLPTTPDSSPNQNHAVITGASPIDGAIDGALYFDGINDDVTTPATSPGLPSGNSARTLMCFITPRDFLAWRFPFAYGEKVASKMFAFGLAAPNGELVMSIWAENILSTFNLTLDVLQHIAVTLTPPRTFRFYVDGDLKSTVNSIATPNTTTPSEFVIGASVTQLSRFQGTIDNPILFSRALSNTEILRHSERRYPP